MRWTTDWRKAAFCKIRRLGVLAFALAPLQQDLTILAPAAPGGGWDQTARVMQQTLRAAGLAHSVQVVNAPGAAGTIGLARFVSADRGNPNALLVTGLVMVSGIAANNSPVTLADVAPIARLSGEHEVVVVPASSPFRTLRDLVAAFRANPRTISWGGGSAGGTDEIVVRLLADRLGVAPSSVNYIAYSGGGQALAAVLGAHVSAAVSGLGEFASQIEQGSLRALAITAPERVAGVDIPTFREEGVDVVLLNWRGVVAPPGLSRSEQRALESTVRRMAASTEWKRALERNGWTDIYMEGDVFRRFLVDETARVAPLVARARSGGRVTSSFELVVLGGGALALVAALIAVWREKARRRVTRIDRLALGTLIVALVVDVALVTVIGFVAASTAMFAIVARAFGSRRLVRDVVVGLAVAAIIHIAFTRWLGVSLPAGVLG